MGDCKHENWHYGMNSVKYCLACNQPIIGTLGDTSLSLLVIDLGDSCVVKVEKGEFHFALQFGHDLNVERVGIMGAPFEKVRAHIDRVGDKPVPRIERRDTNSRVDGMPVYLIRQDKDVANDGTALSTSVYDALTALNGGKPLPIWSGGIWTELCRAGQPTLGPSDSLNIPVGVWRYTR